MHWDYSMHWDYDNYGCELEEHGTTDTQQIAHCGYVGLSIYVK